MAPNQPQYRALDTGRQERLYLGGTTKMLEQPEYHDVEKVKHMLMTLEEEELMNLHTVGDVVRYLSDRED